MVASGIAITAPPSGPGSLRSLTLAAVPNDSVSAFAAVPSQLPLSWYMAFFQLPLLPELWASRLGGIDFLWSRWSPGLPHLSSSEDKCKGENKGEGEGEGMDKDEAKAKAKAKAKQAAYFRSIRNTFEQRGVLSDAINFYRQVVGRNNAIARALVPVISLVGYLVGMVLGGKVPPPPKKVRCTRRRADNKQHDGGFEIV